jgi:hypothetical protein
MAKSGQAKRRFQIRQRQKRRFKAQKLKKAGSSPKA